MPKLLLALAVAAMFVPAPPAYAQATPAPRPDPLTNGALIGAAVGGGLAMVDYLIDPSEPGNAVAFTVAIGLGAAIGAGIDALIKPRRAGVVSLSPIIGKRKGLRVSVRL